MQTTEFSVDKEQTPELYQHALPGASRNTVPSPFKSIARSSAPTVRADATLSDEEQVKTVVCFFAAGCFAERKVYLKGDVTMTVNETSDGHSTQKQPGPVSVRAQTLRLRKPTAIPSKEIPVGSQDTLRTASIEILSQRNTPFTMIFSPKNHSYYHTSLL